MFRNAEGQQRGLHWEVTERFLLVVTGYPGTGKTSVGEYLEKQVGLNHFDVDKVRAEFDPTRRILPPALLKPEQEGPLITLAYKQVCERAEVLIETLLQAVVLSGTFSKPEFKEPLLKLIQKLGQLKIPVFLLRLVTDDSEILNRFESRLIGGGGGSNVNTLEALRWSQSFFEALEGVVDISNGDGKFDVTIDSIIEIISQQIVML